MKEIYKEIYLNEIELPNNPLKAINNYLIQSEGETLMVDTAFNTPETIARMEGILEEKGIDPSKMKLFLTHLHSDHTGLASWFESIGTEIYMGSVDSHYVNTMTQEDSPHWKDIEHFAKIQGLEEDQLDISDHPGFRYRPRKPIQVTVKDPGSTVKVGSYTFEVIDIKGHTPGIVGLYEKEHKLFFCGDHILGKITPNITFWGFEYEDILGTYFENLKKVYDMDINHLFSSHRELLDDYRKRIETLFSHHEKRLFEAVTSLEKHGPSTVRMVTKNLSWDIRAKNWDEFPKSQKWFAAGEAHAHLEHLYHKGEIKREERSGVLYYSL
ncbi:MBL fold metallo-hydrolase [Guggenheimella bovis]